MTITHIRNARWIVAWDAHDACHVYEQGGDVVFEGDRLIHVGGRWRGLYMSAMFDLKPLMRSDHAGRIVCTEYALSELLLSGVTTVADLSMVYDGWIDILAKSGMRAYVGASFRDANWTTENGWRVDYEWDLESGRRQMDRALAVMDQAEAHPCGLLRGMVCPSQIDTCSAELLRDALAAAEETDRPYQVHTAQAVAEFDEMTRRHGKSPITWAHDIGILSPRTILSHAVFIDQHSWLHWPERNDLRHMAESGTAVAHCPNVIARYGLTLQHLGAYRDAGITMSIGTDTQPQNMLDELRWALILARVHAEETHVISTRDVFHMATVGGARALGRDDIGRLAPGCQADIVLVDAAHPMMQPLRDPLRSLIYSAQDRAVCDVYVAGKQVVADGRVLTLDHAGAAERLNAVQAEAEARSGERDRIGRTSAGISPLSHALRSPPG